MKTLLINELEETRELNEILKAALLEVESHISCLELDIKDFKDIDYQSDTETLKAAVKAEKEDLRMFYDTLNELEEILTKA